MFALIRVFRPVTDRLGRRSSTVSLEDFNHLREKVEKLSNELQVVKGGVEKYDRSTILKSAQILAGAFVSSATATYLVWYAVLTKKNPEIAKEVEFVNIVITAMKTDLGSIKAGMASFKAEMASFKTEIKAEMASFKTEVKAGMASFKDEMGSIKAGIGSIKAEMASFKDEMKTELKAEMCSIKDEVKTEIKADMGLTIATKGELTSAIASAKSEILNAINSSK